MTHVLRVVGPPGSGKSLLITSLTEELRSRGYRTVAAARREDQTTVFTYSNGTRVVVEQWPPLASLPAMAAAVDPSVSLLLAEAYDDPGTPAIETRHRGAAPYGVLPEDLFAVEFTEDLEEVFARGGPGGMTELTDRVQRGILGDPAPPEVSWDDAQEHHLERGFGFGRLLRRFR